MSTTIKLRRSAVPGNVPTVSQLELGEIAINTADGKLYFKRYNPTSNTESIIDMSADLDAAAILELIKGVDGANSGLDADLLDGQDGSYYLDYNNFTNVPPATLDLTLSGKVTGNAFSNTGIMTLITELANTGVIAGTYGSASLVPVITVDEDGRITNANTVSVAGVSNTYWSIANNTFTIETADGGIYNTIIEEFNDITANNIIVSGLVDGRDIAADGAKLDLLEDGLDLTLTGKVTGFASSNTGVMTIATELANTGVIAGVYGSSTAIPVFTVDEDGRLTTANTTPVAGVDNFSYAAANNTITLETGDGSIFNIQTETEVTLTGKVTGTATATDGNLSIATELANTGVVAGSYGSSTSIPVLTIDEDGRITVANTASVAGVDNFFWTAANNTLILQTGDGTEYVVPIEVFTDITVNDLTANNIIVSGTVDGRDIASDGSKLDGIEAGATADQTANEILSLLLTVDGSGSGLDADLLDGANGSFYLDYTNFTNTPSATDLLNSIKTVDGSGSGLDADLLDGYHASEIIALSANAALSSIGDGTVTISGTGALSGTGTFNLNDFSNTSIIISHADTSTQASVNNSGRTYIQDITLDTYGHITALTSATETVVDTNTTYDISSVTTTGGAFLRLTAGGSGSGTDDVKFANGNAITVAYTDANTITINHNDTSSIANVNSNNSNGVVIQDFAATFDTYGHVQTTSVATINLDTRYYTETELNAGQLNNLYYTENELDAGQLDTRYYTETESDLRFVNVTGDTMTGALTVQDVINQNHSTFISAEATTTTTAQTIIYAFPYASYGSAEIIITAKEGSNRHTTKLLIAHNGSTAIATEYGTIFTNTQLATFEVSIVGPVLAIQVTAATSSSTNFKIVGTLLAA